MKNLSFQSTQEKLSDGSPVLITRIKGSIFADTIRQLENKLMSFFDEGTRYLILILTDVEYMGSTGIAILLKVMDKFQQAEGEIKYVCSVEKNAFLSSLITYKFFKTYETSQKALEVLSSEINMVPDPMPPPPPFPKEGVVFPHPPSQHQGKLKIYDTEEAAKTQQTSQMSRRKK